MRPSQFVWEQRMLAHPGVAWIRPSTAGAQAVGSKGDTFVLLDDQQLVGLDSDTGLVRWRLPQTDGAFRSAALDAQNEIVYGIDNGGSLHAFQLAADAGATPTRLWQTELYALGAPTLLPLPQGGVLAWIRQTVMAVTVEGFVEWRAETPGRLLNASNDGRSLILATDNDATPWWTADSDGLHTLNGPAAGKASSRAGQTWLYTEAGLYQWQKNGEETAVLQQPLPAGNVAQGAILALSDGGVLLAHVDAADRRLIAYTAEGGMRWERSYRGQITGRVQLLAWKGYFYLLEWGNGRAGNSVTLYAVNMTNGTLRKIFAGGTRQSSSLNTWSYADDQAVYIHIGGSSLIALDPRIQP